jgi:Asp/Glu/hydantoin racemase
MTPAEIQLVAPAFFESFKSAEKEGYDAVVPLGTLELGIDGVKSAVEIPVIGPTEAALHVASLVVFTTKARWRFCAASCAATAWSTMWSILA